jgi:ribosomal protein S18 acetylase RimI-like enzyme
MHLVLPFQEFFQKSKKISHSAFFNSIANSICIYRIINEDFYRLREALINTRKVISLDYSHDRLPMIAIATPNDASELDKLVNSAYRGESSRQGWTTEADLLDGTRTDATAIADLIRTPGTVLLKYVEENKILGCVELRNQQGKLYLGMLTVMPNLQGKGIGKKLMYAAEEEAKNQHCTSVFMTVISVRKELIDWYVRHGYEPTGEKKPFAFNDPRFGQPKTQLEFVVLEKKL